MDKIEIKEPATYSIEVDNVVYPIAQRTGELEKSIISEYDEKLSEMTEYEKYKTLTTLLLGKKAFDSIFPLGEKESLDKMAQIAWYAQKGFNTNINQLESEKVQESMELSGIDELTDKLKSFNKQVDSTIAKSEQLQTQKKRKK